jgi:O-antigen/teichoic acid export membrane protein
VSEPFLVLFVRRLMPGRLNRAVSGATDVLRRDSLTRNSAWIIASTILNSAMGYVFWIVAAHGYSPAVVGLVGALISAMTLTAMVANLGISFTMVQLLPTRVRGPDWSLTFSTGFLTAVLASTIAGTATALVLPLVSHDFILLQQSLLYVSIFVSGVVAVASGQVLDSTYVAERAAANVFARNAVASTLKLGLVLAFLAFPTAGVLGLLSPWVVASGASIVVGLLVLVPRLDRGFRMRADRALSEARILVSHMIGHYLVTLASQIGTVALPLIVATRISAAANAYFYTTWLLASVFFIVSPAVAYSLFAEGSHSVETVSRKARSSVRLISILIAPLMAVFLVAGGSILSTFGADYARQSVGLLDLFVLSAIPDAITNVYVSVLRVEKRFRFAGALNIGMAIGTLVLAWVLLPPLGIAGAGWAWLTMQTAGSIVVGVDLLIQRARQRIAMPDH